MLLWLWDQGLHWWGLGNSCCLFLLWCWCWSYLWHRLLWSNSDDVVVGIQCWLKIIFLLLMFGHLLQKCHNSSVFSGSNGSLLCKNLPFPVDPLHLLHSPRFFSSDTLLFSLLNGLQEPPLQLLLFLYNFLHESLKEVLPLPLSLASCSPSLRGCFLRRGGGRAGIGQEISRNVGEGRWGDGV
ncbi:hypothetical protein V8G54_013624 [Vigna mungo]|uniref:Uncharacterized protein n=1 Tax=Vigna mungo TaxID=3915 RepID=A0AAQ3NXA3_VIGMU